MSLWLLTSGTASSEKLQFSSPFAFMPTSANHGIKYKWKPTFIKGTSIANTCSSAGVLNESQQSTVFPHTSSIYSDPWLFAPWNINQSIKMTNNVMNVQFINVSFVHSLSKIFNTIFAGMLLLLAAAEIWIPSKSGLLRCSAAPQPCLACHKWNLCTGPILMKTSWQYAFSPSEIERLWHYWSEISFLAVLEPTIH